MRPLFLVFLLAAVAVLVPAADDSSIAGNWQVHTSAAGREGKADCALVQKSGELTGTCTTDRGTVPIAGKVEGKRVTWTYKTDSEGGPVTVVFDGTAESADKMAGKVTALEFSIEGEFTATRSK